MNSCSLDRSVDLRGGWPDSFQRYQRHPVNHPITRAIAILAGRVQSLSIIFFLTRERQPRKRAAGSRIGYDLPPIRNPPRQIRLQSLLVLLR